MAGKLNDPATFDFETLGRGGVSVTVHVPTYETESCEFTISVERDKDGDWVVSLPWPDDIPTDQTFLLNGMEVANGVLYLGAPDTT